MNKVMIIGRLTRNPEVRWTQGQEQMCTARFTLAVDRRTKENAADFISCVAFRKTAEFLEKYGKQGMKLAIEGRIQTGSYTNRDGQKIYTTDVVVEAVEFAESKKAEAQPQAEAPGGFMAIPDGVEDDGLPFG